MPYGDYSQEYKNYFNNQAMTDPTTAQSFLGSNFDFLQNTLKNNVEGKNSIFAQLFGNASRKIGASTDRAVQDIKEMGAQSGFRGAGGNLLNDAYRNEGEALSQVSDSLSMQELQFKQNAINQLLGLNQFEGGQKFGVYQSDRQQGQFDQSQRQAWNMFQEQLAAQNKGSDFWDVLGGILGSAGGALGGGWLGALGSNLFKSGQNSTPYKG